MYTRSILSSVLCNSVLRRRSLKLQNIAVQVGTCVCLVQNITYCLVMSSAKTDINNFQVVINKKGTFHFHLRLFRWHIELKMWLKVSIWQPINILPIRQIFFRPLNSHMQNIQIQRFLMLQLRLFRFRN